MAGESLESLPEVAQKKPGGQSVGFGLPSRQEEPAGYFPLMAVAGHRCWCSCPGQRGRESMLLNAEPALGGHQQGGLAGMAG